MNFFVYTASVLVKKIKTVVTAAAIFHFSYSKCGRTADLSIAYWKKQIVLCPNINDNDKEWCNEFVEKMEKMEKSMKKSFLTKSFRKAKFRLIDSETFPLKISTSNA